jgi:hypothetical protein
MGKLSEHVVNEMLDHILKVGEYAQPTNIYIALFNGDPTGVGTECPGTEYARIQANAWDAAASRTLANTSQIDWAECETDDWGTVTYIAIYDAITGGNLLGYDAITSYTIELGDNLYIATGDLDVSLEAGGICNTWANKLLDHIFKNDALIVPTNIYIGASTADPTDNASGLAEPAGGSYARKNFNTWNIAANKATSNNGDITFVTATGSWGTISHLVISDHLSEVGVANIIFHGALGSSAIIGNGDTLKFNNGDLDIAVDA